MSKIKISYSQLNDFLSCHYKHYLGYGQKLKKYESDTIHLIFGNYIHSTIELFMKKELDKSSALIHFSNKMLQSDNIKRHGRELIMKFRNQGIKILNEFFNKYAWDSIIVIDNELELDELIYDNFFFVGKIDFIYRYKNFIYIADFKTSTDEWDEWKLKNEYLGLQLKLYKWFYCQKTKIPLDNIRLLYMVLNRNDDEKKVNSLIQIYEVPSTYGELKKAFNLLSSSVQIMHNPELIGDYLRKKIGYNCNICEFNKTEYCTGNKGTKFEKNKKQNQKDPNAETKGITQKNPKFLQKILGN